MENLKQRIFSIIQKPHLTPHNEFRGFCWLISYYNPDNTEYEKAVADYKARTMTTVQV